MNGSGELGAPPPTGRDRRRAALASAAIGGTLLLQAIASFDLFPTLLGKSTRNFWPFLDYPMYDVSAQEGAVVEDYELSARCEDGVVRRLVPENTRRGARANISAHYDLGNDLFAAFLDERLMYSCAYFPRASASLEEAQLAKLERICSRLRLGPDTHLLEIGSGWGGLAAYLSQNYGVDVTGLTLSTEQHLYATDRVAKAGLADHVGFKLLDYREEQKTYDRIVSVGMFEHVGRPHYNTFFAKVRALLADDGVALIHTIGRADTPSTTNGFIAKYIFPGGYIPALSEIMPAIERAGLFVTDIEVLRLHYAETLKAWRARFCANWARAVEIEVEIGKLGAQGDGLAERPDGPLFVPFTLPSELVKVEVEHDGKHAALLAVLTPSPSRVEPVCPHFGACGGCALQHLERDAYLAWKRELVVQALRSRGLDAEVEPVHPVPLASRRLGGRQEKGQGQGRQPAARGHRQWRIDQRRPQGQSSPGLLLQDLYLQDDRRAQLPDRHGGEIRFVLAVGER